MHDDSLHIHFKDVGEHDTTIQIVKQASSQRNAIHQSINYNWLCPLLSHAGDTPAGWLHHFDNMSYAMGL